MNRDWAFPSSYPWMISSLKLRNCKIYWNMVGVIEPFYD